MSIPAMEEFTSVVHDSIGVPAPELLSGESAEPVPGSYLLLLTLAEPLTLKIRKRDWRLSAGLFVYAGSAHGPGGLKARLTRHFRTEKKPHWHIDRITLRIRSIRAHCYHGISECDLCARLLASGRFSIPIPDFGSSDCRTCPSHFLEFRAAQ